MLNSIIYNAFDPQIISTIGDFITNPDITSTAKKADSISDLLKNFGFIEVGCGTNRIVFRKEGLDGIVFKIALDRRGLIDNDAEAYLSSMLQPYVAQTYDNITTILAQEMVDKFTSKSDFVNYSSDIFQAIVAIGQRFVLNDIGPESFMNWGLRGDSPVVLDYAYLKEVTPDMDFTCRKLECDGPLCYDGAFKFLNCQHCGATYTIGEICGTTNAHIELDFNMTGVEGYEPEPMQYNNDNVHYDEYGFNTAGIED